MKKRYVLKNKARFILSLAFLFVVLLTIVYSTSVLGYKQQEYKKILVREGNTLWSIACEHYKGTDIRKYIYELKKINNLTDSTIFQGDELLIPVE
jgi:hypothetical protein